MTARKNTAIRLCTTWAKWDAGDYLRLAYRVRARDTLCASQARTRRLLCSCGTSRLRTVNGQGKLKHGAFGLIRNNPQAAVMGLNDRTANRRPHSHAVCFGCVERLKYPLDIGGAD